jgi:hypothetical protein
VSADPYSQPPDWVAELLAAVLMAHGRGIDAADAGWDFLRSQGVILHVEDRRLLDRPSDRSRVVLVIDAAKSNSA